MERAVALGVVTVSSIFTVLNVYCSVYNLLYLQDSNRVRYNEDLLGVASNLMFIVKRDNNFVK